MEKEVDQSLQKNTLSDKEIQKTVASILSFNNRQEQAKYLGISRQALHKRLVNYPEIQNYVTELTKISNIVLQVASIRASRVLIKLLESKNERISLEASKEILDRVGLSKKVDEVKDNHIAPRPIMDIILDQQNNPKYQD